MFHVSCFMIVLWLEINDVFLRFFLLFNSITSAVTACNVSLRKLELIPGFHFYITEINSKHQSSFLFSLEVELMLILATLNRLKSFRWYFLMFANNWIYWEVELLQHVEMKCSKTFYWNRFVKSFHLTIFWQVLVLYFNPTISSTYKHYYKVINNNKVNGNRGN